MERILILPLVTAFLFLSPQCLGGSLSLTSGYHQTQHQYLDDTSRQEGRIIGASVDLQYWRRKNTGWFARGPSMRINQAPNLINLNAQVPLFQWHKHQGTWLSIDWQQQNLQTQTSASHIFLNNAGTRTSLPQNSIIVSTRQLLRIQAYWYESTQQESTVNIVGLSYSRELSPVISGLSTTDASLFEGEFTGIGMMLGRIKDDKGFNFQWRLNVANLESSFSNNTTQHRLLAKQESAVYKLALNVSWHYRYYLAPYWYLVPQVQYQFSYLTQSESAPINVEHSNFIYTRQQSTISIRHYF